MIKAKKIPSINIIGLTAFTSESDIVNCLDAGMTDVLSKPLNLKEFKELLSSLWNYVLYINDFHFKMMVHPVAVNFSFNSLAFSFGNYFPNEAGNFSTKSFASFNPKFSICLNYFYF